MTFQSNITAEKILHKISNENDHQSKKFARRKFGLEILILDISKFIIIYPLSLIVGILGEMFILHMSYMLVRTYSRGGHSKKNYQCVIMSLINFILLPYFITNVFMFPRYILWLCSILNLFILYFNAGTGTAKYPVTDKLQRNIYRKKSIIVNLILTAVAIIIPSLLIQNLIILGCFTAGLKTLPVYKK